MVKIIFKYEILYKTDSILIMDGFLYRFPVVRFSIDCSRDSFRSLLTTFLSNISHFMALFMVAGKLTKRLRLTGNVEEANALLVTVEVRPHSSHEVR